MPCDALETYPLCIIHLAHSWTYRTRNTVQKKAGKKSTEWKLCKFLMFTNQAKKSLLTCRYYFLRSISWKVVIYQVLRCSYCYLQNAPSALKTLVCLFVCLFFGSWKVKQTHFVIILQLSSSERLEQSYLWLNSNNCLLWRTGVVPVFF